MSLQEAVVETVDWSVPGGASPSDSCPEHSRGLPISLLSGAALLIH